MKKTLILALIVLVMLVVTTSVFAQTAPKKPDVFVRTVPIVKILTHQLGYKIYYTDTRGDLNFFYVPVQWFTAAGGKGSITYGSGPKFPYFSIYWLDNEFSHIKLFLVENIASETWGILTARSSAVEDKFAVEEPEIEF
jgi:hypothetical protein